MNETDGAVTNLIERCLAIVANDDYERFGELLTDDCSFTLMPIGHTWSGRDNVISTVAAAGRSRTHDSRSKVNITNWFTNDEYLVVEYEHAALVDSDHCAAKIVSTTHPKECTTDTPLCGPRQTTPGVRSTGRVEIYRRAAVGKPV